MDSAKYLLTIAAGASIALLASRYFTSNSNHSSDADSASPSPSSPSSTSTDLSSSSCGNDGVKTSCSTDSSSSKASSTGLVENPSQLTDADRNMLEFLTHRAPLCVFIKGTVDKPRCKFSRRVLELLPALLGVNAPIEDEGNSHGNSDTAPSSSSSSDTSNIAAAVAIENEMARVLRTMQTINQHTSFFDILSDQSVREGLKTFSNWQSYPQVWHRGVLIGGVDIVEEMVANGQTIDLP